MDHEVVHDRPTPHALQLPHSLFNGFCWDEAAPPGLCSISLDTQDT